MKPLYALATIAVTSFMQAQDIGPRAAQSEIHITGTNLKFSTSPRLDGDGLCKATSIGDGPFATMALAKRNYTTRGDIKVHAGDFVVSTKDKTAIRDKDNNVIYINAAGEITKFDLKRVKQEIRKLEKDNPKKPAIIPMQVAKLLSFAPFFFMQAGCPTGP